MKIYEQNIARASSASAVHLAHALSFNAMVFSAVMVMMIGFMIVFVFGCCYNFFSCCYKSTNF